MAEATTPFFSVVMPVFNKIAYLETALESVRQQTFTDFELICVDDGSSDGCREYLQQLAAKGDITFYTRDEPGPGGYKARNLGARKARGQWLVFVDADDVIFADHLQHNHALITQSPDLSLFVSAHERVIEGTSKAYIDNRYRGVISRKQALEMYVESNFLHMNSVCMARAYMLQLGGFPEDICKRGGDNYFWINAICHAAALYYSHTVISRYIVDNSGVVSNRKNIRDVHPLAQYIGREGTAGMSQAEIVLLKKIVNKKILLWVREKYKYQLPFKQDLGFLFKRHLSFKQIRRLLKMYRRASGRQA